uniref:Uncharacterized protein n=1 Tax=Arundo donax TaxID=35708 RepID=A0A0A9EDV3_ARUDO
MTMSLDGARRRHPRGTSRQPLDSSLTCFADCSFVFHLGIWSCSCGSLFGEFQFRFMD